MNDTSSGDQHVTVTTQNIRAIVESFICTELMPDALGSSLDDDARLISDGIIDSMASLRLVAFLEEEFDVMIKMHQVNAEHMDTLDLIVATVVCNRVQL